MNVASLDLCKELYELSGWDDDSLRPVRNHDSPFNKVCPAYDLGYLLRKFPYSVGDEQFSMTKDFETWLCRYGTDPRRIQLATRDKTPEDAACRLAVELFKSGVLLK